MSSCKVVLFVLLKAFLSQLPGHPGLPSALIVDGKDWLNSLIMQSTWQALLCFPLTWLPTNWIIIWPSAAVMDQVKDCDLIRPGEFWSHLATRMTWDREASKPEGSLETLLHDKMWLTSVRLGLVSTRDPLSSLKRSQGGRTNPLLPWFSSSASSPLSTWVFFPSDPLFSLVISLSASDSLFSTHSNASSHVWGFGQIK